MYNDLEFKLESFEGPLDLLLHLIRKNKLDICDVAISEIADQFFEYIQTCNVNSLELSSEFLLIMSDLFEIKSKMLIPMYKIEEHEFALEDDPRQSLVERLLEYKKVVQRRDMLEDRYSEFEGRYFRDLPVKFDIQEEADDQDYDSELLSAAMAKLIDNLGEIDFLRERFFEKLRANNARYISIEDRSREILALFANNALESISFEELLLGGKEALVSFLAVLELMKLGAISAFQSEDGIILKFKATIDDSALNFTQR